MLSPEKLAFSRDLSRDLKLWCVLTANTRGNSWKPRRLHCPRPNCRCFHASHFGVKKTCQIQLKIQGSVEVMKNFLSSHTGLTDQSAIAIVNQK